MLTKSIKAGKTKQIANMTSNKNTRHMCKLAQIST